VHHRVDQVLQRKVVVSDPGDPLEREADRIADAVVASAAAPISPAAPHACVVQRQIDSVAAEDDELDYEIGPGDESGRPKLASGASHGRAYHDVAVPRGGGAPLGPALREFMERGFRRDFAAVRVHRDREAAAAARSLDARAFTLGSHIYLGPGADSPHVTETRRLLAHELVHVVQQTGSRGAPVLQRKKDPEDERKEAPCAPAACRARKCIGANPRVAYRPACGNETCETSKPAHTANFIRHLDVNLATQMVTAELGTTKQATAAVGPFLSSPNPSDTPKGTHVIGIKCGKCHTNRFGEGMAWFTSFKNTYEFGFHNSQAVKVGTFSHGCVRVPCSRAEWIHGNTWSGKTTVCVHTGDHCRRKVFGIEEAPTKKGAPKKKKVPARRPSAPPASEVPAPPAGAGKAVPVSMIGDLEGEEEV
jgi:hypothetical protein